jgi:hypothetical protein
MAVAKSDLKFYLTAAEPGVSQSDPSLSLGGYVSTTPLSLSAALSAPLGTDAASISLSSSLTGRLLVGGELMSVTASTPSHRGDLATLARPHPSGAPVYAPISLFNNSFNDDYAQYRCVAVRNENASETFHNLEFYLKYASRNADSIISFAIEAATTLPMVTTASKGTTLSITSSLLTGYGNNHFKDCAVQITSGVNTGLYRTVASSDSSTGTLVFTSALTFSPSAGDTFVVWPKPAQRISSGVATPDTGDNISPYTFETGRSNAVSIDIGGFRSTDLGPYDVTYLWFKRQTSANVDGYDDNRVVFTANYETA